MSSSSSSRGRSSFYMNTTRQSPPFCGRSCLMARSRPAADRRGGRYMTTKRVVIVIPAFNEERTTVEVIRGLKQRGFTKLIIVDDGSNDRTGELASSEGV